VQDYTCTVAVKVYKCTLIVQRYNVYMISTVVQGYRSSKGVVHGYRLHE
jgi:hypothetical protein